MAKGLTRRKPLNKVRKVIKTRMKPKYKPVRRSVPSRATAIPAVVLAAVDATVQQHIPPHIPMGPYTVIKSRVIVPITTSITSQQTVLLLGAYGRASTLDQSIGPAIAILGVGTNVPGITESYFQDAAIATFDGNSFGNSLANGNLHALTVVVNCTSSATAANGLVYYGAVNQRVNRSQFATYNELAQNLFPRREFSSKSAYSLCTCPHKLSAFPVDLTDWSTQKPLVETSLTFSDNIALDSLSQLAIIFPDTVSAVQYTITVYTEWRINFTSPVLASTSVRREPAPPQVWNKAIDFGTQVAGSFDMIERGIGIMGSLGSMYTTMNQAEGVLGMLGTAAKFVK